MARTIQEIYNEGVTEKQQLASLQELEPNVDTAQNLLTDVTSNSKTAKWRLMLWVMSYLIRLHELLWDAFKLEMQNKANELITGTRPWHRAETFAFQFGDTLTWNGAKYTYPVINELNKIVKRVAVIEVGGQVRIKVAKLDSNDQPTPLDNPEYDALQAYWQQIKFAGTNISIVNKPADELHFEVNVYFDPLLMLSDGSLISDGSKPVENAILNYISELPFNGQLSTAAFIDAIQAAEGVNSPFLVSMEARSNPSPFQPISDFYTAEAGYLTIDPLIPIEDMINYIPYGPI
ncbi:MAG: hypothetical protein N4A41_05445 [Crocinitomicaceae bacterium]|jgi:hypothetical protein|nr:hypothetical protein [Crocinitomicaceae bacterium]